MRKFSIVERSSGWYVVSDIGVEDGPFKTHKKAKDAILDIVAQEREDEWVNAAEARYS